MATGGAGRVVLVVGHPGEPDAGAVDPRGEGQSGAVVAHRTVPSPDVGLAQLLEGEQHGLGPPGWSG